ncbi:hypothetical protein [Actinomyces sp.]|uniref:hypothetical protein n=1 Tax=Actinomyces sp. TaxID=29317 RepID=UPI0026DC6D1C|nr:hypothetical protein [Actinomyces sp.]MDO4899445.1 hypothetical protein [Actinomyces sp.]
MRAARVVVPDVELWEQLVDLLDLASGLQAAALLCCVAGLALSGLAWAGGRVSSRRLSQAGKAGVVVSIAAAFCVAALPSLIGWIVDAVA